MPLQASIFAIKDVKQSRYSRNTEDYKLQITDESTFPFQNMKSFIKFSETVQNFKNELKS